MYLLHGEPVPQDTLKATIGKTLGRTAHIPQHGEKVEVPF